jgi:hypothetical protein
MGHSFQVMLRTPKAFYADDMAKLTGQAAPRTGNA